jgi:RNA polymerase sigma factor (TIGR02999 family)
VPDFQPHQSQPLFEQVYTELLAIARQRLRDERRGHTLQATALVHEVWVRMNGDQPVEWGGRAQFFAAAVEAMRRVLIDHARKRGATKRGGGHLLSIEGVLDLASDEKIADALALDDLILRLEKEDAQAARVVRLRFYAGLSVDETAAVLGVGPRSVDRDWAYARAWLQREWQAISDS